MRSNHLRFALLGALMVLATGASTGGVKEADRWQKEADVARANNQWDIAYDRYFRIAQTFPGTPHGIVAARRARWMQNWALSPDRSPASEDPVSWTCELFDFVTWP